MAMVTLLPSMEMLLGGGAACVTGLRGRERTKEDAKVDQPPRQSACLHYLEQRQQVVETIGRT